MIPTPGQSGKQLRCVVCAEHPLTSELILRWLSNIGDNGATTCVQVVGEQPLQVSGNIDLVIIGTYLHQAPGTEMVAMIRKVRQAFPAVPIILVCEAEEPALIAEAMRQGVSGYIPTCLSPPVAAAALRLVLLGGTYCPPTFDKPPAAAIELPKLGGQTPPPEAAIRHDDCLALSPREQQVLGLLRVGQSNRQIAARLQISENTVMVHVRHLMRKLGATNRAQAVFKANKLSERGVGDPT